MENTKGKRVIFSENIDPLEVLSKFLRDNGFEESVDDAYEKIKKGQEPFTSIVSHGTLDFAEKKVSEKGLIEILEKGLNTSKKIAEKLVKKIKTDLLPLTINFVMDDENISLEKQTATINPIRLINEKRNNIEDNAKNELRNQPTEINAGRTKGAIKLRSSLENKEATQFPKKQDDYREPIK